MISRYCHRWPGFTANLPTGDDIIVAVHVTHSPCMHAYAYKPRQCIYIYPFNVCTWSQLIWIYIGSLSQFLSVISTAAAVQRVTSRLIRWSDGACLEVWIFIKKYESVNGLWGKSTAQVADYDALHAMLNRCSHGRMVTGMERMQWATADSTGYVAADTLHHFSRSTDMSLASLDR